MLLHCLYFNVKLTSIFLSYENIIYYYYHLWSHQLCIVNPYKIVYNRCHNISPFSTHSIVISYIHPFVHCYIIYTSIVHCHILLNNNHKTSPLSIYIPLVHSHIHYYTVTTSVQYTHYSIIWFTQCFSSIVGPNGSGKSNVIDSMLFVFGYRAKKIRSKSVSVLIHNSEHHQNIKSCTVSVYFQNIIDLVRCGSLCLQCHSILM